MTTIAIIQARTSSTRLPKKVLMPLGKKTALEQVILRAKLIPGVTRVVLAIADEEKKELLINIAKKCQVNFSIGPTKDVLSRYLIAAKENVCTDIIRITSDCPLICPDLIGRMLKNYLTIRPDIMCITGKKEYLHGLEAEIFSLASLIQAGKRTGSASWREHVTPWLHKKARRRVHFGAQECEKPFANLRWTLDYKEDYALLKRIFDEYDPKPSDHWLPLAKKVAVRPELVRINRLHIQKKPLRLLNGWQNLRYESQKKLFH